MFNDAKNVLIVGHEGQSVVCSRDVDLDMLTSQ